MALVDRTVLFNGSSETATLSESYKNFNYLCVKYEILNYGSPAATHVTFIDAQNWSNGNISDGVQSSSQTSITAHGSDNILYVVGIERI